LILFPGYFFAFYLPLLLCIISILLATGQEHNLKPVLNNCVLVGL